MNISQLQNPIDPAAPTQPNPPYAGTDPLSVYQPIRVPRKRRPRRRLPAGPVLAALTGFLFLVGLYLFAPLRTNLLILGIDRTPPGTAQGRSDTMILVSVVPLRPYVGMLSIPRDLWVDIRDVGQNRINTAHFFAEVSQPGSGPRAALNVVQDNFGVRVPYYLRVRFDSFTELIDALGGVTIHLDEPTSGYEAGTHHLDSTQALAFVRDRKGADDFFRMQHGQLLIRAVIRQLFNPTTWPRLPAVLSVALRSIDTNLPVWEWPRLGVALLRGGLESQTLPRQMVTPTTTAEGASVLMPDWSQIQPLVQDMFSKW